ncbi:hypothetical protein PVAND_006767 [Polypedilum vanderplanki]|uniref:Uncharacterized protein n=1 Tax=Polypedilum vanderplanki TaxID=319348 RepID=A0A9J6C4P8_POLVA|nr:hypothetical protein PVAND_006767 [Polypedilum vanderplanki]
MATSSKNTYEKKKEEYENIAQEKFNTILAAYRQIVDEINPNHFKIVDQVIGKEMKKAFDVEKAGNIFKEHLFDLIKKKFIKTWSDLDMNEKIAILEYSKDNFKFDEKWRPTNKSVEAQCNPHEMKYLLNQKEFLQRQIEFQNEQILNIVPQIEEARKHLKSFIEKRNQISLQVKQDLEKLKEAENELAIEINETIVQN